ncbi:unnamed protein product [Mytilus coruscus]|uniref:G-protein coupled receptors family 1 profile domain-containing protein n=1 Tax=Mytilus coruscus TaxID=42192 RepID=A0A6J8E534_MYTCO|nr:unnamed protein product [Mytilus coruscus]
MIEICMAFDDNVIMFSFNHSFSYDITTSQYNLSTSPSDLSDTDFKAIKEAAKWLWIIVSPILLVFGLIGNIGILLVLWRMKVFKNLTYIFLFILATINTVVLIVGLTSLYFLITTLPVSVLFVVDSYLPDKKSEKMEAHLELAKAVLYLFQFSFYAVNFYIYIEISDDFRKNLPCCNAKNISNNRNSISRGVSSFSTASRYLSYDESRNDTNNATNYGTERDINSNSNTFVPNYQFSELSATCQTLPDLPNRQSSLSATCESITELPNRSFLELSNSVNTIDQSDIENPGRGNDIQANGISFELSSICRTIRE